MSSAQKIITVGLGTCGVSAGGLKVLEAVRSELAAQGLTEVAVRETGCLGVCHNEVIVAVDAADGNEVVYGNVTPDLVKTIIGSHLIGGEVLAKHVVFDRTTVKDYGYLANQVRIVLRNCGMLDPRSIDEYLARNGYEALKKALTSMTPDQIIDEVTRSGLRGRGGAGFPTGMKWRFTRAAKGEQKYLICNADEGDPGAFMDRSVLEGDTHSVLEGMIIGGFAIGASTGVVYVRAEYPMAIKHLKIAIEQATERGMLGDNILGSGFSFHVKIKEGAGAFVCGEETAMIASIEGRRGMPRFRPPFPANSGLWGKPTNINNVETFANIPWIILNGADKFNAYGIGRSRGTKVFALAGKIARGGLIEVPMGMPISKILYDIGGGTISGRPVKAVQLGGPSGGCISSSLFDLPIDYESINQTGAIMGSGGMVVMDDTSCMVDIARFFLRFTQNESCGKCTFCRVGTKRMLEILDRICEGDGREGDIELLEDLAHKICTASLCGLGQTAPNPVLTTIRYFRSEYEAHIRDKKCPAKYCKNLITFCISDELCTGCTLCFRKCPVHAIKGERKQVHEIIQELCTKCGECYRVCKFDAVLVD